MAEIIKAIISIIVVLFVIFIAIITSPPVPRHKVVIANPIRNKKEEDDQ